MKTIKYPETLKIDEIYSKTFDIYNKEDTKHIIKISHALSSEERIDILRLISKKQYTLSELAKILNLQPSSVAFHLKILTEANLVSEQAISGKKGVKYSYAQDSMISYIIREIPKETTFIEPFKVSIPIGNFSKIKLNGTCGLASDKDVLTYDPNNLYSFNRNEIQLIWSSESCLIEYLISNKYAFEGNIENISISFEACSEAMGYNPDFPSDLTIFLNDIELCTYTLEGDYGDRYGRFTPRWWFVESTKYGTLVNILINNNGVYLNEKLVNKSINLKSLNLKEGNNTQLRLEVKENAENCSGINLFGEKFGDYQQPIEFIVNYEK